MSVNLDSGAPVRAYLKRVAYTLKEDAGLRTRMVLTAELDGVGEATGLPVRQLSGVQDLVVRGMADKGSPVKVSVKPGDSGAGVVGALMVRAIEAGVPVDPPALVTLGNNERAVIVEARLEGNQKRGLAVWVVDVYAGPDVVGGLIALLECDIEVTFTPTQGGLFSAPAVAPSEEGDGDDPGDPGEDELPPEPTAPPPEPDLPPGGRVRRRARKAAPVEADPQDLGF